MYGMHSVKSLERLKYCNHKVYQYFFNIECVLIRRSFKQSCVINVTSIKLFFSMLLNRGDIQSGNFKVKWAKIGFSSQESRLLVHFAGKMSVFIACPQRVCIEMKYSQCKVFVLPESQYPKTTGIPMVRLSTRTVCKSSHLHGRVGIPTFFCWGELFTDVGEVTCESIPKFHPFASLDDAILYLKARAFLTISLTWKFPRFV